MGRSTKGKVPWITYNGIEVADSQFCIEFLAEKLDKNLSAHLSPYERSIARAFLKLNEESARWYAIYSLPTWSLSKLHFHTKIFVF